MGCPRSRCSCETWGRRNLKDIGSIFPTSRKRGEMWGTPGTPFLISFLNPCFESPGKNDTLRESRFNGMRLLAARVQFLRLLDRA